MLRWVILVAAAVLFFLWGYCLLQSYSHYRAALALERRSQPAEAAREFQTAIQFYAPLNPWSRAAALRLASYRDPDSRDRLRRALLSIRSFYQPYGEIVRRGATTSPPPPPPREPQPLVFLGSVIALAVSLIAWNLGGGRWSWRRRLLVSLPALALWAVLLFLA